MEYKILPVSLDATAVKENCEGRYLRSPKMSAVQAYFSLTANIAFIRRKRNKLGEREKDPFSFPSHSSTSSAENNIAAPHVDIRLYCRFSLL